MAASAVNKIELTRFTKDVRDGPLSKRIELQDGRPVSDGSACYMWRGTAKHIEIGDLDGLVDLLSSMSSQQALTLGTIRADLREGSDFEVVTARTMEELKARPSKPSLVIARTHEFIVYEPGKPALLLFDFDRKGMPDEIRLRIEAVGGFYSALSKVVPALEGVGYVERASTSAGLSDGNGTVFTSSGGLHVFVVISDGTDAPRALKVLLQRLWLAGLGWHIVSKGGALLERGLIDVSVGGPERLVFEGAPELIPPLVQDQEARKPIHVSGGVLDTRAALPDLTAGALAQYEALITASKHRLKPELQKVRDKIIRIEAEKIRRKHGVPLEKAREVVRLRWAEQGSILLPQTELVFDDQDIGTVTVAEVLADPARFDRETLADPLEGITYGRCKAMVMRDRDGNGTIIHSFAHGRIIYRLVYDEDMIVAIIGTAAKENVVSVLARALPQAHLSEDAKTRLIKLAAQKAKCGIKDVRAEIRKYSERLRKEKEERIHAERPDDNRVVWRVPRPKAPIKSAVKPVDDLLASVHSAEPPMRNAAGRLFSIVEKSPMLMHQLLSDKQREASADKPLPPAPSIYTLEELDEDNTAMLVEEHIMFLETDAKGVTREVRYPPNFCRALRSFSPTDVPVVYGVQSLPLVLTGGELLSEPGLHRQYQLFLKTDPGLTAMLPKPEECTVEAARKAYRFLCDEVLADVQTSPEGKAILVALILTVIERPLLPERPAFFITAGQAESGKTTAAHIVSAIANGKHAGAASWSDVEEERRKTIFSHAREGTPLIVWDNIKRGTQLDCPRINAALTSPTIEDRVLGESRTEIAPATTVHVFTGNAVSPKGDLARRSLCTELSSTRSDPANRTFKHPNVVDWVRAHRPDILRPVYTILLVDRSGRVDVPTPTRFKQWMELIGIPIEIVADVDFSKLFAVNTRHDEETDATVAFMSAVWDEFGTSPFTARDAAIMMEGEHSAAYVGEDAYRLREALHAAAGGPGFPPNFRLNSFRVGKKLKALVGRTFRVESCDMQLAINQHDPKHGHSYKLVVLDGGPPVREPRAKPW